MKDLTIVIPARSEEFLKNTVEDILKNKRANTEIIVGLDGEWSKPPLEQHPDVTVIYYNESIGQRAISNQCVKLAKGKYIMKLDAHCAMDEGFDTKMLDAFKETGDNVVMVPTMGNLHAFDWKCYKCGKRVYQDKIDKCPPNDRHKEEVQMKKKILWNKRRGSGNSAYYFSPEPKFGYHGAQKQKQKGDIVETMSLQGSCFMVTKEKYEELNLCDEELGSWGSQGIEVACKMWLSGGRVLVNKKTWYAHMFRTKAIFGFPYKLSGNQVQSAKQKTKDMFFNKKWPQQKKSLRWLVEKFMPVPEWTQDDIDKLSL